MKWRGLGTRAIAGIIVGTIVTISVVTAVILTRPYGQAIDGFFATIFPQVYDNEIRLVHSGGDYLEAGKWEYSISTTSGNYSWVDLPGELIPSNYLSLGTYAPGTYYVSFRNKLNVDIGDFDYPVTVTA